MNALEAIALIAEGKIREAQADGIFDHLPGAGKPLVLEDLSHLPPEARLAHIILKNSGFAGSGQRLLPEAELARSAPEEGKHNRRLRRLNLLLRRVRRGRGADPADEALPVLPDSPYLPELLRRLPGPAPAADRPAPPGGVTPS
jgi:transposase InsO family protein